ncbi:MAG: hypothetical protein ACFFCS_21035 [Candidatus Hodarchaeota archaeon]
MTSIKRVPTVFAGVSFITSAIGLLFLLGTPDLSTNLVNFSNLIYYWATTLSFVLYCYLIYQFSVNVKGMKSRKISIAWIGGVIMLMSGSFLDSASGVQLSPGFLVFYGAPVITTIGMILAFYSVNKLFFRISSYYTQTQKCTVHRGEIGKGNPLYSCPSCDIVYCMPCYDQVIKKEGCWNCGKGSVVDMKEKQIVEPDLEQEETGISRGNSIPKRKDLK